jgi:hypothetical protein
MRPIMIRLITGTPVQTYSATMAGMCAKNSPIPSTNPAPAMIWTTTSTITHIRRPARCHRVSAQ